MARPRLPTALLELRGAFKHDPQRKRARQREPLGTPPLPDAPDHLTDDVAKVWRQMKTRGYWLTSADQFLVEIAATLAARFTAGQLKHGHVSVMIGLLGKLGFLAKKTRRVEFADKNHVAC
ncbi:hypothetical protein [Bradyrhizobium liaoningense]|uniref:hypothetical protein n=1 Tax=Bradyrhizobium liaoningense TaxID=43992 RepID=UPI001BA5A9BC|nr:hypothetical protein [Bradyrhizobium liaoningense]MBR0718938.1 hypothetical protein [Bradyrhizobium liaoningense]